MSGPIADFFQSNGLWIAGFIFYLVVALVANRHEHKIRLRTSERRLSKGITSKQLWFGL